VPFCARPSGGTNDADLALAGTIGPGAALAVNPGGGSVFGERAVEELQRVVEGSLRAQAGITPELATAPAFDRDRHR
jgi:hypothetical protein